MLDTLAREWLSLIEEKKRELEQVSARQGEELKRYGRLKSPKMLSSSKTLLDTLEAHKSQGSSFVQVETLKFFRAVFKIELYQPVAVRKADGALSKAVYATQFIARMLSNGAGIFTVSGDSVTQDLHKGVPACELLMANEANGEWLLAIN